MPKKSSPKTKYVIGVDKADELLTDRKKLANLELDYTDGSFDICTIKDGHTHLLPKGIDKIIALIEQAKREEKEKYNEAVVLVVDIAGLKQSLWEAESILGLAERAEEILKALKANKE